MPEETRPMEEPAPGYTEGADIGEIEAEHQDTEEAGGIEEEERVEKDESEEERRVD
jgi:hypothetical protein